MQALNIFCYVMPVAITFKFHVFNPNQHTDVEKQFQRQAANFIFISMQSTQGNNLI